MDGWVKDRHVTCNIIQPQYRISFLMSSMLLERGTIFVIHTMRSGLKCIIFALHRFICDGCFKERRDGDIRRRVP